MDVVEQQPKTVVSPTHQLAIMTSEWEAVPTQKQKYEVKRYNIQDLIRNSNIAQPLIYRLQNPLITVNEPTCRLTRQQPNSKFLYLFRLGACSIFIPGFHQYCIFHSAEYEYITSLFIYIRNERKYQKNGNILNTRPTLPCKNLVTRPLPCINGNQTEPNTHHLT